MARRVTVPATWWSPDETRRTELAMKLGGLIIADGAMLNAWRLSERFFIPHRRGIPWPAWIQAALPHAVIEVGLAKLEGPEVFVAYLDEVWGWFFKQSWAGKVGVGVRVEKYGTAQPGTHPIIDQAVITNDRSSLEKIPIDDPKTSNHLNLSISSSLNLSSSPGRSTFGGESIGDHKGAIAAREILNTVRRNGPGALWISQGGRVDNYGPLGGVTLKRSESPYSAILGNLALSPDPTPLTRCSWQELKTPKVLRAVSQSESDNVYAGSLNGLKKSVVMPTCASVRLLRVFPQCEDFDSHAAWTLAQYEPLRAISRYRAGLTGRADQLNQGRALAELRKGFDSFRIAAAIRDVERNGTVGSCAWERPEHGIAAYLVEHMPAVIARIECMAYQRERRRLAAERARQRRRFQDRSPRVHAFRAAFTDRRARRRQMDLLRAEFPRIFAEIPRASVAELGVAAQLWGQP